MAMRQLVSTDIREFKRQYKAITNINNNIPVSVKKRQLRNLFNEFNSVLKRDASSLVNNQIKASYNKMIKALRRYDIELYMPSLQFKESFNE